MRFALAISLMFFALTCEGATYYVDFASGNDANEGTSSAAPWQRCPGDTLATGVSSATTLAAGDTVNFKGGVEYNGVIRINASGTAASRITYQGQPASWGSGRAIIDGTGAYSNAFLASSARHYITIDGFECRDLADGDRKAIHFSAAGNTNNVVANCFIWDVGSWEQNHTNVQGGAIMFNRGTQCVASNNVIEMTGNSGIFFIGGVSNVAVANRIGSYVNWCIGGSSETGNDLTSLVISRNTITNFYLYDTGFRTNLPNPHQNGIFVYRGSGGVVSNTLIERNLLYNDQTFTNSDGSYAINTSYANTALKVLNNVIINPHSSLAVGLRDDGGAVVANNTIYAPSVSAFLITPTSGGTIELTNNIIVCLQTAYEYSTTNQEAALSMDYNLFAGGNGTSQFAKRNASPTASYSWSTWRGTFSSRDGNSIAPVATINFVSTNGYPTNCGAMDLRLSVGSDAIGAGADLSSLFTDDYDGVTRAAPWDIGAFEYQASGGGGGSTNTSGTVTATVFNVQRIQ